MTQKKKSKRKYAPRFGLRSPEFEESIIELAMTSSFSSIEKGYDVPGSTSRKIFRGAAHKLKTQWRPRLKSRAVGIDDAHPKRREEPGDRKTCTVFTDLSPGDPDAGIPGYPIVDIIEGTDADAVVAAFIDIPGSENVDTAVTDGSPAYKKAIEILRELGWEIMHVLDPFHVIRKAGFALEDTIKAAANKERDPEIRELLLHYMAKLKKRPDALIRSDSRVLRIIAALNPHVKQARDLYRSIHKVYNSKKLKKRNSIKAAKRELSAFLRNIAKSSRLVRKCFTKAIRYIRNRRKEILNFFLCGLSNGPAEMNNRRYKKVMGYSKGCLFEIIAVRVMYDSGVWQDGHAIKCITQNSPPPPPALKLPPKKRRKSGATDKT